MHPLYVQDQKMNSFRLAVVCTVHMCSLVSQKNAKRGWALFQVFMYSSMHMYTVYVH